MVGTSGGAAGAPSSTPAPGVRVVALAEIEPLRAVARLFGAVWGRNADGVPVPSEMLRSMVHAGGLVSAAYDATDGALLGAAALGRAEAPTCYSYIAAAAPGFGDRGIGFLLKQHQRSWALGAGIESIRWTFDPLVSRNARFNLVKLGAVAREYHPAFYGRMSDTLNGTDPADRLGVCWDLASARATQAAAGSAPDVLDPPADARVTASAPDGGPGRVEGDGWICVRAPRDVVSLRRADPDLVADWRYASRGWFGEAFQAGWTAVGMSRGGWYRLERLGP